MKSEHISGSSETDVIIGSDRDWIKGCKKKDKITCKSCVRCTKRKRRAAATSCMN